MKLCRECKFCESIRIVVDSFVYEGISEASMCSHELLRSPVTGEPYIRCMAVRNSPVCGDDGKLWEKK